MLLLFVVTIEGYTNHDKALRGKVGYMKMVYDENTIPRRGEVRPRLICVSGCEGLTQKEKPDYIHFNDRDRRKVMEVGGLDDRFAITKNRMPSYSCEGYDFEDDPVVSRSSCTLLYSLERKPDIANFVFMIPDLVVLLYFGMAVPMYIVTLIFPTEYMKLKLLDRFPSSRNENRISCIGVCYHLSKCILVILATIITVFLYMSLREKGFTYLRDET